VAVQIAELRRCPTCNRWGGKRSLGADGFSVELDSEDNRGPCREGPWHGSPRGPRNACGQWLRWVEIRPADEAQKPPPAPESVAAAVPAPSPAPVPDTEPGKTGSHAGSPA